MVILLQLLITYFCLCYVACLICLAFGTFFIALSLVKDVKCDLNLINESAKSKNPLPHILKQVAEFVRAHSSGKQLREYNSTINKKLCMSTIQK